MATHGHKKNHKVFKVRTSGFCPKEITVRIIPERWCQEFCDPGTLGCSKSQNGVPKVSRILTFNGHSKLIKKEIRTIRDCFKSVKKYSPIDFGSILKHLFIHQKMTILGPKPVGVPTVPVHSGRRDKANNHNSYIP